MADYESMSIDEIENAKVALKGQLNATRDEMARAEAVHSRKVKMDLAERTLAAAGITGVIIAPEAAQVAALSENPEVTQ